MFQVYGSEGIIAFIPRIGRKREYKRDISTFIAMMTEIAMHFSPLYDRMYLRAMLSEQSGAKKSPNVM